MFLVVSQVVDSNGEFFLKSSELFESPVYLEEVADVLCILQAGTRLLLYTSGVIAKNENCSLAK